MLKGPHPPEWFKSDGCTCAPDTLYGISLFAACRIHDWHYWSFPDGWRHRLMADNIFYDNLRSLGLGPVPSLVYYTAVRVFGSRARRQKQLAALNWPRLEDK